MRIFIVEECLFQLRACGRVDVVVAGDPAVVVVVVESASFIMLKIAGQPESNSMTVIAANIWKFRCFIYASKVSSAQYPIGLLFCK